MEGRSLMSPNLGLRPMDHGIDFRQLATVDGLDFLDGKLSAVGPWSRRRAVTHASKPLNIWAVGSTFLMAQHASG